MSTPTLDDHQRNALQYPICGKCGTVWRQHGNRTGHCAKCHETFEGSSLFDRHQRLDASGAVTCLDPATIELGSAKDHLEKTADGAWQGPRMPDDVIQARFGRSRQPETAI